MDPDLQIKGGGGEGSHTRGEGGGPGLKFFFRPFGSQLGPQIKAGEGRGGEGWGDFSAISTTERSSASPIPKVESNLSDRC